MYQLTTTEFDYKTNIYYNSKDSFRVNHCIDQGILTSSKHYDRPYVIKYLAALLEGMLVSTTFTRVTVQQVTACETANIISPTTCATSTLPCGS
eukprot:3677748-Amphidinium_carterae.1